MTKKEIKPKFVSALNTLTGLVATVPAVYIDHAELGEYLVEVPDGTKDYDSKFFKGGTAADHKAKPSQQKKADEQPTLPTLEGDAASGE